MWHAGLANATSGGWGNLGGGVTQLLMPLIFNGLKTIHEPFLAWRWGMFVPAFMHIVAASGVLFFAQDLPDGNYAVLKKKMTMTPDSPWRVFLTAMLNYRCGAAYMSSWSLRSAPCIHASVAYGMVAILQIPCRTWCLTVGYGFCFGVELTMNNIIVTYLFDQFGLSLAISGVLGSLFGLMNLCARSFGGLGSDLAGKYYGMRGRVWSLWLMQTFEGVFCIFMGLAKDSLWLTIVLMVVFSLLVQASEGATFGVVPFVSKRSLGVVSGFVGAGGNAGSVITQSLFFKGERYQTYDGLIWMGVMVIAMTVLVTPIYFPMWGGMFTARKEGVTEEDYYYAEYDEEEKEAGKHRFADKFINESRSQRPPNYRTAPEQVAVEEKA
jgi:MFS transporter, NNP family, nitrate/nitrite transporter